MSRFQTPIGIVDEGRRALADALRATDSSWDDGKRRSFDGRTLEPLLREAVELVRDLEATADLIEASLARLGRR